eukprot:3488989-Prymnesium_polylepis.1
MLSTLKPRVIAFMYTFTSRVALGVFSKQMESKNTHVSGSRPQLRRLGGGGFEGGDAGGGKQSSTTMPSR